VTVTIELVLYIVALVFGVVAEVEGRGRSWAAWGVIAIAAALIYGALS
jgi:drug/metabolite transporter superfamily protein YnfA